MYQRIKDLREDNDVPQKELAAYLQCSQACYSRYESGARDIPPVVLTQLADYYGTSVDYLLGITNEIQPYPKIKKQTKKI